MIEPHLTINEQLTEDEFRELELRLREEEEKSGEASVGEAPAPPLLEFTGNSFSAKAKRYMLRTEGGALFVEHRKARGEVDPRAGLVGPAQIVSFSNQRIGMLTAIVLDLDGNGIETRGRKKAKASFDMDGDGARDDTGWMGKGDGVLVIDRNKDSRITAASELSFAGERPDTLSSLQGLGTLDSNRDGTIDAADERFGELKVWVDRNGDGVSGAGELRTLAEHGIKSLSLDALATSQTAKIGSNVALATTVFTRENGTTGSAAEIALAFRPSRATPTTQAPADEIPPLDPSEPAVAVPQAWPFDSDHLGWNGAQELRQGSEQLDSLEGQLWRSMSRPVAAHLTELPTSSSNPLVHNEAAANSDYQVRVQTSLNRLIQAMAVFRPVEVAASLPAPEESASPEWPSIAAMPSVQGFLTA